MKSLKELREDKGKTVKEMQDFHNAISAENRAYTAEEDQKWDEFNAAVNKLSKDIERQETLDGLNADLAQRVDDKLPGRDDITPDKEEAVKTSFEQDRSQALRGWFRNQSELEVDQKCYEAAKRCNINIDGKYFNIDLESRACHSLIERRALSIISGSAGEFTIAEGFIPNIESALLQFGGMRVFSEILRSAKGGDLPWPTSDDTSNKGVLIGENITVSEQDVVFGQLILKTHKYSSNLVKVPVELLEDSEFDLASWLGRKLGERLGRITNEHYTTGTGAAQPRGIVTGSTLGVTTASGTAIDEDELVDLVHSVDPAYRSMPSAGWMMNDAIVAVVRKIKDSEGQFMWRDGLELGVPNRLLGFPVVTNQDMVATITSGDKTVLFGDLGMYKIREIRGMRLRRLVERFADTDQEGFVAFLRADGNLLDAGTNPVKHIVQV